MYLYTLQKCQCASWTAWARRFRSRSARRAARWHSAVRSAACAWRAGRRCCGTAGTTCSMMIPPAVVLGTVVKHVARWYESYYDSLRRSVSAHRGWRRRNQRCCGTAGTNFSILIRCGSGLDTIVQVVNA